MSEQERDQTLGRTSNQTLAQSTLLRDLVGMPGLEGDDDDDLELGSEYAYGGILNKPREAQSTNMTSMEFKQHHIDHLNSFAKKGKISIVNEVEIKELSLNDRNDTS